MPGILNLRGAIHGDGYTLLHPLDEDPEVMFEARHARIAGRYVVRLFPEIDPDSAAGQRLDGAVRAAQLLRHAGVAQVLDFSVSGAAPVFVALEPLTGRSLQEAMAQDGIFPLNQAVDLLAQVAETLRTAHALNIFHGDLHPGAIRLTADPEGRTVPKVVGFGWSREARVLGGGGAASLYTAPELQGANAARPPDARADQFAFAAIAYEMLAGCGYMSEESSDLADPDARRLRQPPPIAEMVLGLPPALDDVLRRGLSFDPERRFASVQDFCAAMRRVETEQRQQQQRMAAPEQVAVPAERSAGGGHLAAAIDAALAVAVGGEPSHADTPAASFAWQNTPPILSLRARETLTPLPMLAARAMAAAPALAARETPEPFETPSSPAIDNVIPWPGRTDAAAPASRASTLTLLEPHTLPPTPEAEGSAMGVLGVLRPRLSARSRLTFLAASAAVVAVAVVVMVAGAHRRASSRNAAAGERERERATPAAPATPTARPPTSTAAPGGDAVPLARRPAAPVPGTAAPNRVGSAITPASSAKTGRSTRARRRHNRHADPRPTTGHPPRTRSATPGR